MSTRLTKGKARSGSYASDNPGFTTGGIPFNASSTAVQTTSFTFPSGSIIEDVYIKVTSVAATSQTISVGLATGASSGGVGNALVNGLITGTAATYAMNASTSAVVLAFSYGSYFIASSSASVTVLKKVVVGSTDTYFTLNYTLSAPNATAGSIYPIFVELA